MENAAQNEQLVDPDDMIRAAVVIGVAAFDRYFTAKFCDVLVPHLKKAPKLSNDLLVRLEKAGLNTEFALQLAVSKRPYRKIRTIVQNSLSRFTTQRSSTIDALFVSLGLIDLSKNSQKKAKRINLNKRIQKLVEIRNDIAHEAHGNAKNITSVDIRGRLEDLKLFVTNCDVIIDNKFGRKPPISA